MHLKCLCKLIVVKQVESICEIGYITSFHLIFEMKITKNDSSNVLIHDRHQHPWLTLTTLITTDILLYTDKK